MIWFLLQKIGFWIFVVLTVYFTFKRRTIDLMKLYFWGMTFASCYQFAFTIWFPTKVIVLGMMACMVIYNGERRESEVVKTVRPLATFFMILLVAGDVMAYMLPGQYAQHINKFSRLFNTNYTYITSFILLFYGCMMPRGFVRKVYPSYCLAMEVAIGFGLLHYIFSRSGIDFMPILRQDGSVNLEALTEVGGKTVTRIYGVGGEPKNLGFLVCTYSLVLLVMYGQNKFRLNNPGYHLAVIIAGVFVLINTYSSAAIMNFAIASVLILLFLPTGDLIRKLAPPALALAAVWGIYSLAVADDVSTQDESDFLTTLYDRSFGRAQNEMEGDRQERVILDYYFQDPDILSKIVGYGPSQYTFHIPGQTVGNALIPVQSGLVLTLVDFGFMGIGILGWVFLILFQTLRDSFRQHALYGIAFSIAALSAFIGSLMFGSLVSCFVYLMLALYGYYDYEESEEFEEYAEYENE